MLYKKRQNTRYTRDRSDRILHLRVHSPRILFFQSIKASKGLFKLIILLGILGAGGYYGTQYVQRHFLTNPEFALRHLDLETNGFLNVNQVAEIAEIDPAGTIFSFDIDTAEANLAARPEIVQAKVERRLPDTVLVKIEERVPVAWIACPALGMAERNTQSGILLDEKGVVFKCQGTLWNIARNLPVIEIETAEEHEFPLGQKMTHVDAARALALINLIDTEINDWSVKRIAIPSFYSLVVTTSENIEATFGMYEHDRQLSDLLAARKHAQDAGKELDWINLLPKHNIPGNFKQPVSVEGEDLTNVE